MLSCCSPAHRLAAIQHLFGTLEQLDYLIYTFFLVEQLSSLVCSLDQDVATPVLAAIYPKAQLRTPRTTCVNIHRPRGFELRPNIPKSQRHLSNSCLHAVAG
jgi:hypothetical protein